MELKRFYFFFSSRRRHTISKRDWSSDVCSSDLSFVIVQGLTRRYENAANAQSEVVVQARSQPDAWRRMHNELYARDELLLASSSGSGFWWPPGHSRGSSAFPSAINVGTDDGFDLACAGSRIPQVPGGAVRGANVQLPDTAAGSLNPSRRLSGKLHLPKRQLHAVSGTNPVLHERSVWRGSVATAGRLRTSSDFRRVRRRYRTRIPQQIHTLSSGLG